MVGLGLLVSMKADSHTGVVAVFEVVVGMGLGTLYVTMVRTLTVPAREYKVDEHSSPFLLR